MKEKQKLQKRHDEFYSHPHKTNLKIAQIMKLMIQTKQASGWIHRHEMASLFRLKDFGTIIYKIYFSDLFILDFC